MSPLFDLGPKPHLGYAASPLDRAAERRADPAYLASLMADAAARTCIIGGELIVLKKAGQGFQAGFAVEEARSLASRAEPVFLGLDNAEGRFAVGLDQSVAETLKSRSDLLVLDLRSIAIQGLVGPDELAQIAEAKALLSWHARHRFCSNCGAPTDLVHGGWRRDCPACSAQHFPRTDPVVIMLPFRGDQCLLGRQSRFPPGMWSCLAGFIEPGESIEDAVRRETLEEAGVPCGRVTYFASQPWPFPSSLMIGCHAEALGAALTVDRTELEDARWFDREETAAMLTRRHPQKLFTPPPIAIAHHIIRAWLERPEAGA